MARSGAAVDLVSLVKRFGDTAAVDDVTLQIEAGEFFSLLGPSGCGKTTSLRIVAGFEQPTSGAVLLDGVDMVSTPPHKRPVNTVFQSYALFPHMTVEENVGYGLRWRAGVTKAERRRRVGTALDLVQLDEYGRRRPTQLSGGQQQRVALARALVLEPAVLLLDEPLGALDAKLRKALQVELKTLHREVGITFVYVTHDQEEALTMSDRLAVMAHGKVAQCGTPRDVYEEPASAYVADFLGVANLIDVHCDGSVDGNGTCRVRVGEMSLRAASGNTSVRGAAKIVVRPERVRLDDHGAAVDNGLPGMVDRLVYLGATTQIVVRLPGGVAVQALVTNADDRSRLVPGTPVTVVVPPDAVRVLDGAGDGALDLAATDDVLALS
jgi:spermidine/putrescine transport system ATP-binding protein